MKGSRLIFVVFITFLVFTLGACSSISPNPIVELAGEWQTIDGVSTLKINSDGTYVYTYVTNTVGGSLEKKVEGTFLVSNDYFLVSTSKDKEVEYIGYFFVKDNRLFLGNFLSTFRGTHLADGSTDGIKGKWKSEGIVKEGISEVKEISTYLFGSDGKVITGTFNDVKTNSYQLTNETKDIASIVIIGANRYCYVLGDWKGNKFMYITRETNYDSLVFKKK